MLLKLFRIAELFVTSDSLLVRRQNPSYVRGQFKKSRMASEPKELSFVKHLWLEDEASRLDGLDRLVYRSNKLGQDMTLTNTGGGNTSSKLTERDPLTGENVQVLWV